MIKVRATQRNSVVRRTHVAHTGHSPCRSPATGGILMPSLKISTPNPRSVTPRLCCSIPREVRRKVTTVFLRSTAGRPVRCRRSASAAGAPVRTGRAIRGSSTSAACRRPFPCRSGVARVWRRRFVRRDSGPSDRPRLTFGCRTKLLLPSRSHDLPQRNRRRSLAHNHCRAPPCELRSAARTHLTSGSICGRPNACRGRILRRRMRCLFAGRFGSSSTRTMLRRQQPCALQTARSCTTASPTGVDSVRL